MNDKILELFEFQKENKAIVAKPLAHLHTFYISGEIKSPTEYVDMFDTIRNASEHDIIRLHINSAGGQLFTAIQFMRVLLETPAQVICSVEGACMSAATMIFLSGNAFEISEHSMFMFHNYSSMIFGKGGEMYDNIVHERKWSERIMRQVYSGFLTETEIKAILDNKDIWMDGEEVIKRLKLKQKMLDTPKPKKTKSTISPTTSTKKRAQRSKRDAAQT